MKMYTEDIIESAKNRTMAPFSEQTFTNARAIEAINEELYTYMTNNIKTIREDLWLRSKEITVVPGVPRYTIPERALGEALKSVFYKKDANSLVELPRVMNSRLDSFNINGSETPSGVMLEGPYIRIVPTPTAAATLQVWFDQRPNELVATTKCAKITAISSLAGVTTFTVDTNIQSEVIAGELVDFISNKSPFVIWSEDVEVTAITASTIEVATADIVNEASAVLPQVGDYIAAAQKTNLPQLPVEFHPILAQAVAVRILSAMGDETKLASAEKTRDRMMAGALALIANRIESASEYINPKYGISNNRSFNGGV